MTRSWKEACEYIADTIAKAEGKRPDPYEDIWKISSTGELWPVCELYEWAKDYNGEKK